MVGRVGVRVAVVAAVGAAGRTIAHHQVAAASRVLQASGRALLLGLEVVCGVGVGGAFYVVDTVVNPLRPLGELRDARIHETDGLGRAKVRAEAAEVRVLDIGFGEGGRAKVERG